MFVCAECGATQAQPGFCPADGRPLAAIGEDLLLGTMIGAYRVARLLGLGGMGRVYKGVHPTIGSRVAIKVLSRECKHPGFDDAVAEIGYRGWSGSARWYFEISDGETSISEVFSDDCRRH